MICWFSMLHTQLIDVRTENLGLLNSSKSLVFTFLCATNQTKDLTLKGTWDFQTKLVEKTGDELERWDKARKKDLIVNNPAEDKD